MPLVVRDRATNVREVVDVARHIGAGPAFNADVLEIEGPAAAEVRLTELDQADPAGRYRFLASGDAVAIQRAASAAWATAQTLITFTGGAAPSMAPAGDVFIADTFGLVVGHTAQITGWSHDNISNPEFQMIGTGTPDTALGIARFSANASGAAIILAKARGTAVGTFTKLNDGDQVGTILFVAADNTNLTQTTAEISVEADGAQGSNDTPGRIVFLTNPGGGTDPTEAMRLTAAGNLEFTGNTVIGTGAGSENFTVDGYDTGHVIQFTVAGIRLGQVASAARSIEIDSRGDLDMIAGGVVEFKDYDAADAVRWSLATATGTVTQSGDHMIGDGFGLVIGHTAQITAGSTNKLQVLGTGGDDSRVLIGFWGVGGIPALDFVRSPHTTIGSHTILANNDLVGGIRFFPDDGVDYATLAAQMYVEVDDATPAAGDIGMAFVWSLMAGGGAALAEAMRLDAAGSLRIGAGAVAISDASGNLSSADGADYGPADATSFTVRDGIITAIS